MDPRVDVLAPQELHGDVGRAVLERSVVEDLHDMAGYRRCAAAFASASKRLRASGEVTNSSEMNLIATD